MPYAGVVERAHSYLVVTYDDGTQYFVRAGSEDDPGSKSVLFVIASYGQYLPGTIDWDAENDDLSVVVFTGTDATVASMYATMTGVADGVNAALYPFVPGVNDCNCFTGTVLDAVGLARTPPLNTDGYTMWCPAFFRTFSYDPAPRFTALLNSRLAWADANHLADQLGAAVFFAEAFIKQQASSNPELVAGALAELDGWLEQTTGTPALTGSNANNALTGSGASEIIVALVGADNIAGAGGNDLIYGGQGGDAIAGGSGNDFIDGGAGADRMNGGTGDDTYIVDNSLDATTELAGEGIDTVRSSVTLTLRADVENLVLTGTSGINGTGNNAANGLTGNEANNVLTGVAGNDTLRGAGGNDALRGDAGDDVLDGGAGSDQMSGGTGNDTYLLNSVGDVVTEAANAGIDTVVSSVSHTLAANVENLTLTGLPARRHRQRLTNTIIGNSGVNLIDGGAGADTMAGGGGNDTYIVDNAGDLMTEQAGAGTDTVLSSVSTTLRANVENLTLTGTAGTTAPATPRPTPSPAMRRQPPRRRRRRRHHGRRRRRRPLCRRQRRRRHDRAAGQGTDTVLSSVSHTLRANVENLTLTGTAIEGFGNASTNTITGNAGNNRLDGGAGADTMVGGLGNDTYVVDNAGDVTTEQAGQGTDTVYSSVSHHARAPTSRT